jgi:hypothetical protein
MDDTIYNRLIDALDEAFELRREQCISEGKTYDETLQKWQKVLNNAIDDNKSYKPLKCYCYHCFGDVMSNGVCSVCGQRTKRKTMKTIEDWIVI